MKSDLTKPLLAALHGDVLTRHPLWFLRQAGRYLPEYQKIRQEMSFVELCKNPEKASEVTLQPLKRFDLDAAIIFSDILIPAMTMGQDLTFAKDHGPVLTPPVRSIKDVMALKTQIAKDTEFVGEAISKTVSKLNPSQTMIGFAGAPTTLACYMIEGKGSKDFGELKKLLFREPETFKRLLEVIVHNTKDYLLMQRDAGAQAIMLFDTWASVLSPSDYEKHALPQTYDLISFLREHQIPTLYYPGSNVEILKLLKNLPCQGLAIDWRIPFSSAGDVTSIFPYTKALQGNLDPHVFFGSEHLVREKVYTLLCEAKNTGKNHIFNVGHGLIQETPIQAIGWAIDEVRRFHG